MNTAFILALIAVFVATASAGGSSPPVQVFVTSDVFTGQEVGTFGDLYCNSEAARFGLTGFRALYAWTDDVKLKSFAPDYGTFYNSEGDVLAVDSTFFFDLVAGVKGGLAANILTLNGEFSSHPSAWTGFDTNALGSSNCKNWTSASSSDVAYAGTFQSAAGAATKWYTGSTHSCSEKKPLICIRETPASTCNGRELAVGSLSSGQEEVTLLTFGRACWIRNPINSGFNIKGKSAAGLCCRNSGRIVFPPAATGLSTSTLHCRTGCSSNYNTAAAYTTDYKYTLTGNKANQLCYVDCYRFDTL